MNRNTQIPSLPMNKQQQRLYAASSDPTFEHKTYKDMEAYLNNATAYFGQLLYCKENDKQYKIANNNGQMILKEVIDKAEYDSKLNEFNEQLDNTVRKKDYIVYIDDYKNLVNDEDWTLAFEKATENIKSNNGGELVIGTGTYKTDKVILTKGMILRGMGFKSIIKQNPNANYDLISLETPMTKFIKIENLTLDGNRWSKAFNNDILSIITDDTPVYEDGTGDIHAYVNNVFIKNSSRYGLNIQGRGENIFSNIKVIYSKSHGLYAKTYDSWFENISVGCSTENGFNLIDCEGTRFSNCKAWMNGYENEAQECDGFNFSGGQKLNVFSCEAQSNKSNGFKIYNLQKSNFSDIQSYDNGDINSEDNSSGIVLQKVTLCNINGVVSNSNTSIKSQKFGLNLLEAISLNNINLICRDNKNSEVLDVNRMANQNYIDILSNTNKISNRSFNKLMLGTGNTSDLTRLYVTSDDTFSYGEYIKRLTETINNKNLILCEIENTTTKNKSSFEVRMDSEKDETILLANNIVANSMFKVLGSSWDGNHFMLGNYHIWIDTNGKLRIKNGKPTSETDGSVVGS